MRTASLLAVAAALSMAAGPAFARGNPAAKLSLTDGGGQGDAPTHHGGHAPSSTMLIAGVAVAAVVIGAVAMSHHDSKRASP